jgi:integrase
MNLVAIARAVCRPHSEYRQRHRDATMILVAYRHGLRASELVDLRWDQVEFRTATLHVRRVKQGSLRLLKGEQVGSPSLA